MTRASPHLECAELSSWTAKGATSHHAGEVKTFRVGARKFSIDEIGAGEAGIVATVYRSDHGQILTLVMKSRRSDESAQPRLGSRLSKKKCIIAKD